MTHAHSDRPPPPAPHGRTTSTHDRFATTAVDLSGVGTGQPDPELPHEQDESSHSQASAAASHGRIGGQAYDDLLQGREDTDRGPVMDQVYNEKVAPHRGPARPSR